MNVSETFYTSFSKTVSLEFPQNIIRAAKPGITPAETSTEASRVQSYERPFGNVHLNSRLSYELPTGLWQLVWKVLLPEFFSPKFVLEQSSRLLLQGQRQWLLLEAEDGSKVAHKNMGDSDLVVDTETGGFYYLDPSGYITSYDKEGRLEHLCPAFLYDRFQNFLLQRRADTYFSAALSYGNPPAGHGGMWGVEKIALGDTTKLDEDKILLETERVALLLQRETTLLKPAMNAQHLVLPTPRKIYLMDESLNIVRALEFPENVEALSFSTDERGVLYLVVQNELEYALWAVSQNGERFYSVSLPSSSLDLTQPPVVGYDYWTYLVSSKGIWAVTPEGEIAWQQAIKDVTPKAVVTATNELLTVLGNSLVSFREGGKTVLLFQTRNETLETPPLLTKAGQLFVATEKYLYCLGVK
jgi:hypothetical protein